MHVAMYDFARPSPDLAITPSPDLGITARRGACQGSKVLVSHFGCCFNQTDRHWQSLLRPVVRNSRFMPMTIASAGPARGWHACDHLGSLCHNTKSNRDQLDLAQCMPPMRRDVDCA